MTHLRERIYRLTSWSPLVFLAGLVALTWWLDTQIQPASWGKGVEHVPDLFFKDFKAVSLNSKGEPQDWLTAQYAEHFLDDESFELKGLKLTLERTDEPRITISAQEGQVSGDRKNIYLQHDVLAVRESCKAAGLSCDDDALTMTTESAHIKPEEKTMTSNQLVTLTSPSGKVETIGIVVDDRLHTMELKSQVRGTFDSRQIQSKP